MPSTKEHPTVFVLGAGASYDYGFPTAIELTELIHGNCPDRLQKVFQQWFGKADYLPLVTNTPLTRIQEAVQHFVRRYTVHHTSDAMNMYNGMRHKFKESHRYSIDAWLQSPQGQAYAEAARPLVAGLILACERTSILNGSWYHAFWNRLVNTEPGTVAVATFNYDRSLQHYLAGRAKMHYLTGQEATIVDELKIYHVYGSLGTDCPYGGLDNIDAAAESITLMRPEVMANPQVISLLQSASKLYFMGFGFDKLNLDALGVTPDAPLTCHARASCLNLSGHNADYAKRCIPEMDWHDGDCNSFFHKKVIL